MTTSSAQPALIDPDEVQRALDAILASGQVTELRILDGQLAGKRWPTTLTGYFDEPQKLIASLQNVKSAKGIYIIPNPVDPALLSRAANRLKRADRGDSTADTNIVSRRWLLIDCDPKRPSGISASNVEHDAAIKLARAVFAHLQSAGWPNPIAADSGNGAHLLYRVDVPTEDDGLIQKCLSALAAKFDGPMLTIDTSVFNPARIWKLYGTVACKGDNTPERPHRMSRILMAPDEIQAVDRELLEALAAEAPQATPRESASTNAGQGFDIDSFITRHNFEVSGPEPWQGGRRWVFQQSPLCEHHEGAAFLLQHASGALTAGCHHNSCNWSWRELRERFEPKPAYQPRNSSPPPESGRPAAPRIKEIHLAAAAQQYVDGMTEGGTSLIGTDIGELDYAIGGGVELGEMVIAASRPSHGKTLFGLQCCHHWTAQGMPVLFVSEEMSPRALGKRTLQYATNIPQDRWSVSAKQLSQDLEEYRAGRAPCIVSEPCRTPQAVADSIERHVGEDGIQAVIVDYAQLLQGKGGNKYEQVTYISNELRSAASRHNVIVLALCQLNREIDKRPKFIPSASDLRDSGALEQDADVILLLVWPHKIDQKQPVNQYQIFVAKNRNRPINQQLVICHLDPSRQTIREPSLRGGGHYYPEFDSDPAALDEFEAARQAAIGTAESIPF